MDQQTKAALKQDNFVTTTSHGLEWASANRKSVIVTVSLLLAAIIIAVAVGVFAHQRSEAASVAFGQAMEVYQSPISAPGQPPMPGVKTFPSVAERAKAANALFAPVASKYGSTDAGKNARYFTGLTYMEQGQTQTAETTLKAVADSWDSQLAALGKFALADLYRQTGRNPQAVELYNQLTSKPTDAIPAGLAQIQLAELYTAEGKIDQAHKIYAQLKDKDAKGVAGVIAAQKLNPTAGPPAPQM